MHYLPIPQVFDFQLIWPARWMVRMDIDELDVLVV